jgi:hypothetical protein
MPLPRRSAHLMVDASEVPEVQQQMRERYARFAQYL